MFFDFECPIHPGIVEGFVYPGDTVTCHCGTQMTRLISPVRIDRTSIALTKGASPESIAHFDRVHRERKAIEEKRYAEHGDYGHGAGSD